MVNLNKKKKVELVVVLRRKEMEMVDVVGDGGEGRRWPELGALPRWRWWPERRRGRWLGVGQRNGEEEEGKEEEEKGEER